MHKCLTFSGAMNHNYRSLKQVERQEERERMNFFDSQNILDRLNTGDEGAMKTIFTAYYPRLTAFVGRFVKEPEDVRDIVQDVFISFYENRGNLKDESFQSLLFTMARNACLNFLKHKSHREKTMDESEGEQLYYSDFAENEHYDFLLVELKQQLEKVINKLPDRTKEAYLMYYKNEMKKSEIAKEMNISERMVDKHLKSAITFIKEQSSLNKMIIAILILLNS